MRAHGGLPSPVNDAAKLNTHQALASLDVYPGGWVVGPIAGSFLAAQTSLRVALFATALCTLAQIVPFGLRGAPRTVVATSSPAPAVTLRPGVRVMRPLLAFTGLYVLVYAGESIKYAYLPIYMIPALLMLNKPLSCGFRSP